MEVGAWVKGNLESKLALAIWLLSGTPQLAGHAFTIADAYFGWALIFAQRGGPWEPQGDPLVYWAWRLERAAFRAAMETEEATFSQFA